MDGPEYSAECVCYRGQRRVLAVTQKQTTGNPHYIETGHIQPADIPEERMAQVRETVCRALEALDIQNGIAHAEFRLLADGNIGVIEVGARMGGDCIGTDLTPISTGIDFLRIAVDIACGNEPCFDVVTEPTPVAIRFIIGPEDLEEYERLRREKPESIVRADEFNDNFDQEVVDSSTRHGYYIVKG